MLHAIDEATLYQSAKFLSDMSATLVQNTFRACWYDVYLGPPVWVIHNTGTNFTSKKFCQNAISMVIQTQEVPIEAHNSIGKVERYHYPPRRSYQIISSELKDQIVSKEMKLQMAVKIVNDSIGPHGLVHKLLVYGVYPRMTRDSAPAPSISARTQVIEKAMKEISKIQAQYSVNSALATGIVLIHFQC